MIVTIFRKAGYGTLSALLIFACLTTIGCPAEKETLWTAAANSPDGRWIASARTESISGPGTSAVLTGVYLQRANSSEPAERILGFGEGPDLMRPRLTWRSPSELDIFFTSPPNLTFQVVKYAGLDVVVRTQTGDVPSGTTDAHLP